MNLQTARALGFRNGQNDAAATASDFAKAQCALLENFRLDNDGAALVRGGYKRLTTTELQGSITAVVADGANIWGFLTAAGARQLVAFVVDDALLGQFYYSTNDGSSWTLIDSGYGVNSVWDHATMRVGAANYLLLVNGSVAKKWDGAALTNISNCPSGAARIAVANERCWVTTAANHFLYGSKVHNPEVWADPDGLVLQIGDALPLTALEEGPSGALLAFKRSSTNAVDGYGESTLVVAAGARGISRSVGCIAFRTVQSVDGGGMCFLSERGIEFLGGEGIQSIAAGAHTYIGGQILTSANENNSFAWYYPTRNEYRLSFPTLEGVVVNLDTGAVWLHSYEVSISNMPVAVSWARFGVAHFPVGITSKGFPLLLESGLTDYQNSAGESGTAIAARLDSQLFDLGQPNLRKWWRIIRASIVPLLADRSVVACVLVDGVAGADHTLAYTYSAGERPQTKRAFVSGRGNNGQVRITCNGGVKVTGLEIEGAIQKGMR